MELEVSATETGASRAYGSSTNGLIVTGVNRTTGVLTFGFNVTDATNGIPAAAADYIFVRGDHTRPRSREARWPGSLGSERRRRVRRPSSALTVRSTPVWAVSATTVRPCRSKKP
jgi:hypothetical protein